MQTTLYIYLNICIYKSSALYIILERELNARILLLLRYMAAARSIRFQTTLFVVAAPFVVDVKHSISCVRLTFSTQHTATVRNM